MTTCSSVFLLIVKWSYLNFKELGDSIKTYMYGYLVLSGFFSLAYCYYRGPISDPRAINLAEWCLKFIGLLCIYWSTSHIEMSMSIIIVLFLFNTINKFKNKFKLRFRFLNKFRYGSANIKHHRYNHY